MALVQEKKGGPYSKDEREKRQNEVFRLHFEFGYSATKISELMKINRNTINADIKYWYSSFKDELKQSGEEFVLKQIGRLEAQRTRIIESITEKKIDDVRYEKLLLDVDSKINAMLLRINSSSEKAEPYEIQEELIKDMILFLIIKHSKDYSLKKDVIISEIVNMQKCTVMEARTLFSDMESLGLECCRKFRTSDFVYDLMEFAYLRRYILINDKFVLNINALYILETHYEAEFIRLNKKYTEEYGRKEKWTDETFTKYDKEKSIETEKYSEASSKMMVEALESLVDQKRVEEYVKCIRVFFGKSEKDRFKEFLD